MYISYLPLSLLMIVVLTSNRVCAFGSLAGGWHGSDATFPSVALIYTSPLRSKLPITEMRKISRIKTILAEHNLHYNTIIQPAPHTILPHNTDSRRTHTRTSNDPNLQIDYIIQLLRCYNNQILSLQSWELQQYWKEYAQKCAEMCRWRKRRKPWITDMCKCEACYMHAYTVYTNVKAQRPEDGGYLVTG